MALRRELQKGDLQKPQPRQEASSATSSSISKEAALGKDCAVPFLSSSPSASSCLSSDVLNDTSDLLGRWLTCMRRLNLSRSQCQLLLISIIVCHNVRNNHRADTRNP
jgi:hypothetical protein